MFMLLAQMTAKQFKEQEVERLLGVLQATAAQEDGNIAYAVHVRQNDPRAFVVYELYQDKDACDRHVSLAVVQDILAALAGLLVQPADVVVGPVLSITGRTDLCHTGKT